MPTKDSAKATHTKLLNSRNTKRRKTQIIKKKNDKKKTTISYL